MIVTIRAVLAERLFNDMAPAGEKRYPGWLVDFSTAHGDGRGWWMGASVYPTAGASPALPPLDVPLPVEFEFGSDFTWNTDIVRTAAREAHPALALDGATMLLRGVFVATGAAGATAVRLGDDLLPVMAHGDPPPPGTPVLLRARRLFLYPTHEAHDAHDATHE